MTIDQIISIILILIAAITLGFTAWQTYLSKKALYGQIYKTPPLEKVGFLNLVAKHDDRVRFNENTKVERDSYIFEEVILPKNSRVPLAVTWRFKEKQSLRHAQFGFELGYNKKPRVLKRLSGWIAKEIKPVQKAEFIDLDGYYHIEYQTSRKFGKGSAFIHEFEIETGSSGNYDFHVEVYSGEAREPLKKILKVIVK